MASAPKTSLMGPPPAQTKTPIKTNIDNNRGRKTTRSGRQASSQSGNRANLTPRKRSISATGINSPESVGGTVGRGDQGRVSEPMDLACSGRTKSQGDLTPLPDRTQKAIVLSKEAVLSAFSSPGRSGDVGNGSRSGAPPVGASADSIQNKHLKTPPKLNLEKKVTETPEPNNKKQRLDTSPEWHTKTKKETKAKPTFRAGPSATKEALNEAVILKITANEGSGVIPTKLSNTALLNVITNAGIANERDIIDIRLNKTNKWVTMKVTKTTTKTKLGIEKLPTKIKQSQIDFNVNLVESIRMGVVRAVATIADDKIRSEIDEEFYEIEQFIKGNNTNNKSAKPMVSNLLWATPPKNHQNTKWRKRCTAVH